ncbi:ribosome 60S biogenesis N-terminal-domain-containing protein [Gaertneriomyces semiglobifer]|nr:ribosome 60S biogenesis N-terminal-domain-containing protein [Gaertneriomyces semiglobifer]
MVKESKVSTEGHEEAGPQKVLGVNALFGVLSSDNVESLLSGLTSFNYSLTRLVHGDVDYEISDEASLLKRYLNDSPECAELQRIWTFQQEHQVVRLQNLIVDVLARVITGSALVEARNVGASLSRSIIRNNLPVLYRNISSGAPPLIQASLRLLTAMATISQSVCKELASTFNFTMKSLQKLVHMRQKSSSRKNESGRSLYIRFLLAFLEHGDVGTKKFLLEGKDLVSTLFKGLSDDSLETVEYVLRVMQRSVIDDPVLPRTAKVAFFNNYILEHITKLYAKSTVAESSEEPLTGNSIADVAHSFLLYICTTPGTGICFQDAGWYPPKSSGPKKVKVYNTLLLRLILTLKPTDDVRQEELLLSTLRSCPELVQTFWKDSTSLSFEPRPSQKYLANMALAGKIIRLPVPSLFGATGVGSIPPAVHSMVDNILPPPLDRNVNSRALLHANRMIQHAASVVLAVSFDKMDAVLAVIDEIVTELGREKARLALIIGDVPQLINAWRACGEEIREEVRRRLPDFQTVLQLQTSRKDAKVGKKTKADDAVNVDSLAGEVNDSEITPEMLQCAALRLIRKFQQHYPETTLSAGFNVAKLLPADFTTLSTDLLIELLHLIIEAGDTFRWMDRPAKSPARHLHNLMSLYLSFGSKDEIFWLTHRTLSSILSSTVLFQHHVDEIPIWLEALLRLPTCFRKEGLRWLDEALDAGQRGSYKLLDRLSELHNSVIPNDIAEHILNTRQRTSDDKILHEVDMPAFHISPALLCLADGLNSWLTRCRDGKMAEDECLGPSILLSSIMRGVLSGTQGSPDYIAAIIERVDTDMTPAVSAVLSGVCDIWNETPISERSITNQKQQKNWHDALSTGSINGSVLWRSLSDATPEFIAGPVYDRCADDTELAMVVVAHLATLRGRNRFKHIIQRIRTVTADSQDGTSPFDLMPFSDCLLIDDLWLGDAQGDQYLLQRLQEQQCDLQQIARGVLLQMTLRKQPSLLSLLESQLTRADVASYLQLWSIVFEHPLIAEWFLNDSAITELVFKTVRHEAQSQGTHARDLAKWHLYMVKVQVLLCSPPDAEVIYPRCLEAFELFLEGFSSETIEDICSSVLSSKKVPLDAFERILRSAVARGVRPDLLREICDKGYAHVMTPVLKKWAALETFDVDPVLVTGGDDDVLSYTVQGSWAMTRKVLRQLKAGGVISEKVFGGLCVAVTDVTGRFVRSVSSEDRAAVENCWSQMKSTMQTRVVRWCRGEEPALLEAHVLERVYKTFPDAQERLSDEIVQSKPAKLANALAFINKNPGLLEQMPHVTAWVIRSWVAVCKKERGAEAGENIVRTLAVRLQRTIEASQAEGQEEHWMKWDGWRQFWVTCLKFRLADQEIVSLLHALIEKLGLRSLPYSPKQLIEMITTHSQFPSIVTPSPSTSATLGASPFHPVHPARLALLRLVHYILTASEGVSAYDTALLSALVSAYQASNEAGDRVILDILNLYENHAGISIEGWVVQKDWLAAVDTAWMAKSIWMFEADTVTESSDAAKTYDSNEKFASTYDPRFWLAYTAGLLTRENADFDGRSLLENHLIGLAVMALSSLDESTRRTGYFLLDSFYAAIGESEWKEKNQVMIVLDGLKNAITERADINHLFSQDADEMIYDCDAEVDAPSGTVQRVPTLISLFISQAISIALKPESELYPLINRFFLQRPLLDLLDVPMFYELFNSSSEQSRRERGWVLRLLAAGVKTAEDWKVLKRRHVADIVMGYLQSAMCDTRERRLIVECLAKWSMVVPGELVWGRGILPVLSLEICTARKVDETTLGLLRVLRILWAKGNRKGVWTSMFANVTESTCRALFQRFAAVTEISIWWANALCEITELVLDVLIAAHEEGTVAFGFDLLYDFVQATITLRSRLPAESHSTGTDKSAPSTTARNINFHRLFEVDKDVSLLLRRTQKILFDASLYLTTPSTSFTDGATPMSRVMDYTLRFLVDHPSMTCRRELALENWLAFLLRLPPSVLVASADLKTLVGVLSWICSLGSETERVLSVRALCKVAHAYVDAARRASKKRKHDGSVSEGDAQDETIVRALAGTLLVEYYEGAC